MALAFGAALTAQAGPPAKATRNVSVVGEVEVAACECGDETTLARVLEAAKPKPTAALAFVVVLRSEDGNCSLAIANAANASHRWLVPGDVVFVPKQPAKETVAWTQWSVRAAALPALLASDVAGLRRAWLQTELLKTTSDRAVRQQMALELARCSDCALGVRMLVGVLDLDVRIASEAVVALGTMGPAAKAALPDLEPLREHRDPRLREFVAVAIRQIAGGPAPKR